MQREAQQEPSVAVGAVQIDAHALAVVGRDAPAGLLLRVRGKRIEHRLPRGAEIVSGDLQPEFPALGRLAQSGEQPFQTAPGGELHQKPRDEIRPVVEKVVFLERRMAGGLNGKLAVAPLGVEPERLIDDVAVAAAEAAVHAAVRGDKPGQTRGCDRVGHDGRAGMLAQQNRRNERDEPVAVELLPVGEDGSGAVNVGIENNAEIGAAFKHRGADAVHRLRQLGVRHMVRKAPVGVKIPAARRVRAERREDLFGKEAARAVSGVHNDALSGQGLFTAVRRGDDLFAQQRGVGFQKLAALYAAAGRGRKRLQSKAEYLAHVRALRAAGGGEEFESVAVPRQVACRDHHGGVERRFARHGRHKHRRSGAETEIGHRGAARGERFAKRFGDRFARKARVAPDAHAKALFSEPRAQEARKAAGDGAHRRVIERYALALHARERHAAHIAAVLQFCQIHVPFLPEKFLSHPFYRAAPSFARTRPIAFAPRLWYG